jgi:hypothetical protein
LYAVQRTVQTDSDGEIVSHVVELGDLSPKELLQLCRQGSLGLGLRNAPDRPRLVGWAPRRTPGQEVQPVQDRSIGFTVFVVHF